MQLAFHRSRHNQSSGGYSLVARARDLFGRMLNGAVLLRDPAPGDGSQRTCPTATDGPVRAPPNREPGWDCLAQDRTSIELVAVLCRQAAERARGLGLDATIRSSVTGTVDPFWWRLVSDVTTLLLWHSIDRNMRGHLMGRIEVELRCAADWFEVAVADDGWTAQSGDGPYIIAVASLLRPFRGLIGRRSDWASNRVTVVVPTVSPTLAGANRHRRALGSKQPTAPVSPTSLAAAPTAVLPIGALP